MVWEMHLYDIIVGTHMGVYQKQSLQFCVTSFSFIFIHLYAGYFVSDIFQQRKDIKKYIYIFKRRLRSSVS